MGRAIDPTLHTLLKTQCASFGSQFTFVQPNQVAAEPSGHKLIVKLSEDKEQVLGEAASLEALERACRSAGHDEPLVPLTRASGSTDDGKAYLITDYRELNGRLDSKAQAVLGKELAEMHRAGQSSNRQFGFERPTFCGITKQDNSWTASWSEFWADRRIGSLVRRLNDADVTRLEKRLRSSVYPLLFDNLTVTPSIIHGDLWSGNVGVDSRTGRPVIFDPSSYYGHHEAELGIMKMFGGFSSSFFEAYHSSLPRCEPHYNERLRCYELYHHLNHALMFGGSYQSGAIKIMESLIYWAEQRNVAVK